MGFKFLKAYQIVMVNRQHEKIGAYENVAMKKLLLYFGIPFLIISLWFYVPWYVTAAPSTPWFLGFMSEQAWDMSLFYRGYFALITLGIYVVITKKLRNTERKYE